MQSLGRAVHYQHAVPRNIHCRSGLQQKSKVTKRQRLFVEECLGSTDLTFDEVMKRHSVSTERFVDWITQSGFRRYLKLIARAQREQAKLILSIGQKRSAMFLLRTASTTAESPRDDKKRSSRVKAAQVLLRFLNTIERQERLNDLRRDQTPTPELVPAGRSDEEILRLMDAIEGKAPAD